MIGNSPQEFNELLIGCGNSRTKLFAQDDKPAEWSNLITLDIDPNCSPDVLHDLTEFPYPFSDNEFDEIHAYEVLEHTGQQGDWVFFFTQFEEFHRVLKPNGYLFGTVPHWLSIWAWGDPGHTRIINNGTLVFLSQKEYSKQVGKKPMTDYRHYYKADFDIEMSEQTEDGKYIFALKAIKED